MSGLVTLVAVYLPQEWVSYLGSSLATSEVGPLS